MDFRISAADKVVGVVAAGKMSVTFLAAAAAAGGGAGGNGVVWMGAGNGAGSFFSSSSNLTKSSPLSTSIKLELLIGACIDAGTAVVSDVTGTVFSLSVALALLLLLDGGCVVAVVAVVVAGAVLSVAGAGKLDTLSVLALTADGFSFFFVSSSSLFSDSASSSSSILSATPLAALAKRTFCNSDLSFGPNMADEKLFRCVLVVALDVLAK